jgi:DNA-binding NarL/FixJ family response regulator
LLPRRKRHQARRVPAAPQEAEFKTGKRLSRRAASALALGESGHVAAAVSDSTRTGLLGKRQAEVAELVAEGLSNKQIGARLFISEHTVDSHVRSILNKLGVNSRAQMAGWVAAANQ